MDKLSRMRVSPAWAAALTACLDEPPPIRRRVRGWMVALVLTLGGAGGAVVVYLTH
ncbi:hypothetical protein L2Y96_13070 [Luteibacter aegosomaticola]|uniref:hypothetical protein n=1 Tax=Luteibacter aegosomaticola TaxID=2911538 RepID=UPI001FF72A22|nr:hypothetical protein [Luteibacter aegosomaticola]UPG88351.1 hypothetical protein L2Y96_13070 [Luteibacter aegosomaticola]